jgi:hypothetical protein
MKIRYNDPPKPIFFFVMGIIICWTVAGDALEPWNAKVSARVNLRKIPGLNGEILSIIPNGNNVRILEKKGLWYKVVVEGENNGTGWVYAKYLERILPNALKTDSFPQIVRVEIASGKQKQETHSVDPPPKSRLEAEAVKPLRTPLPEKIQAAGVKVQSAGKNELPDTKKESNGSSQLEFLMAVEPVYMPPVQPPYAGFLQDGPESSGKDPSGLISKQISKQRSIGPVEIALKLLSILLQCFVVLLLFRGRQRY